jgi:hypothetical protein
LCQTFNTRLDHWVAPEIPTVATQIKRARESPVDIVQAVGEAIRRFAMKRVVAVKGRGRAIASASHQRAIEYVDRIGHVTRLIPMVMDRHIAATAANWARGALDLLLPPHCIACRNDR